MFKTYLLLTDVTKTTVDAAVQKYVPIYYMFHYSKCKDLLTRLCM